MLLTLHLFVDIIDHVPGIFPACRLYRMKPSPFRQWIVCTVIIAVLFNTATPMGVCRCAGCPHNKKAQSPENQVSVEKKCPKCCGAPPVAGQNETSTGRYCCGTPDNTPCRCCSAPKDHAVRPAAGSLVKKPDFGSSWNVIAVNSVLTWEIPSCSYHPRVLLPPHVPLHVLLCVFLN